MDEIERLKMTTEYLETNLIYDAKAPKDFFKSIKNAGISQAEIRELKQLEFDYQEWLETAEGNKYRQAWKDIYYLKANAKDELGRPILRYPNDEGQHFTEAKESLEGKMLQAFYDWRKKTGNIDIEGIITNPQNREIITNLFKEWMKLYSETQAKPPSVIQKLSDLGKINNVYDRCVLTSLDDIAVTVYDFTQSPKGIKAAELKNLKLKKQTGKEYSESAYTKAVNYANTNTK